MSETGLLAAVAVALGIGIQNFPEGAQFLFRFGAKVFRG